MIEDGREVFEALFDAGEGCVEGLKVQAEGAQDDRLAQGALIGVERIICGDAADLNHAGDFPSGGAGLAAAGEGMRSGATA